MNEATSPPRNLRGRLFRKYAVHFVAAIGLAVLAQLLYGVYSAQHDLREQLDLLRHDKALSAKEDIEEFIQGIQQQLDWLVLFPVDRNLDAIRLDAGRLLRQVPAISHVRLLDAAGKERLFASRFDVDRLNSALDASDTEAFRAAHAGKTYFGPITFRGETEPYITTATPERRRNGGVLVVEINLKAIWDVITAVRFGKTGYAYVTDETGTLVAHPDISLVLQKTNFQNLPQVSTALAALTSAGKTSEPISSTGISYRGETVVSTAASLSSPRWLVFVEQPLSEADAPVNAALLRTIVLMLIGLLLSLIVSYRFARRMLRPIETLGQGAAQFGAGALGHRIRLDSDDELEVLAHQFNVMADRLQESYATLERKIEERTRELDLANQTKTRFLAAASHDLRQPVHALGLLLSGIRGKTDPAELQTIVRRAGAAVEAITELLDSVLDISKLDAGIEQPKLQDFRIDAILDRIAFDFGPEAQNKDLELRIVRSSATVRSDPLMLARILLNLVSNAIRYTQHGKVLIGCRRRGSIVRIEVWDTGAGIPADKQADVFQEFYRADEAGVDRPRGLGLGLSIVKRLATLLDVPLELSSTVDRGSMFAVSLPSGDIAHPAPAPEAFADGLGEDLTGRRVLVVDDDAMVVEAMQRLLSGWGCDVVAVTSGRAATERLAAGPWRPDIVICDYDLHAAENGIGVLKRLAAGLSSSVTCVLMTADTTPQVMRAAEAAHYPVVHKPVRPAKLRSLLSYAVRSQLAPGADV